MALQFDEGSSADALRSCLRDDEHQAQEPDVFGRVALQAFNKDKQAARKVFDREHSLPGLGEPLRDFVKLSQCRTGRKRIAILQQRSVHAGVEDDLK